MVLMVMMENDDEGMLIDSDIQQVELGISSLTIIMGKFLSSDLLDSPSYVQMDFGVNSI